MDSRLLEKLGADPNYPEYCDLCGGNCVVVVANEFPENGEPYHEEPCPNCGGTGYVDGDDQIMEDYKLNKHT